MTIKAGDVGVPALGAGSRAGQIGSSYETFLDELPNIGSVCSGGRYDNLLSSIGGSDMTAVGLGFGDVVVCELLGELVGGYERYA